MEKGEREKFNGFWVRVRGLMETFLFYRNEYRYNVFIFHIGEQWRKFSSGGGGAKLREFPTNLFEFFIVFGSFNKYEQAQKWLI